MTAIRLLLHNLRYHARGHAAVVLGIAVATVVLTGALLVGDSLRGSLRDQALNQLGDVDHVLLTGRFFREEVANGLPAERVVPALVLQGAASTVSGEGSDELPRRVGRVMVHGVASSFWRRGSPFGDAPHGVFLNAPLARELGVQSGDSVVLSLQKASRVPRETLLGRRDARSVVSQWTVQVGGVLAEDAEGARFNLNPSPAAPRNAFVSLETLQEHLGEPGRVNGLLVTGGERAALQESLRLTLDDWNLVLHDPQSRTNDLFRKLDRNADKRLAAPEWNRRIADAFVEEADRDGDKILTRAEIGEYYRDRRAYLSLESRQMLLESAVVEAALRAAQEMKLPAAPTLVYLANRLSAGSESIPYSVVAALDPSLPAPLGPFHPRGEEPLKDGEILLADWKESPLRVKPGEEVTLTYFEPIEGGQLREQTATFRVRGLVPLTGVAADPDLTPEFPGITDKLDLSQWDPPFPYEQKRIRPRDDAYWKQYRTTPKAYVTLAQGQKLWGNRFGATTSIRLAGTAAQGEEFRRRLLALLTPERGGFVFDSVRERALLASAGSTDFGGLFLGFSFFLILAALLLVNLLFRLNLDRRATELGLLFAVGFSQSAVRLLLLAEGVVLALVGGGLGTGLAILYARLLLDLLRALWPSGVELSFLRAHVTILSLSIGFIAILLTSLLTILWAVHGLRKVSPRSLLGGVTTADPKDQSSGRRRWSPILAVGAGLLGLALLPLGTLIRNHEAQAGTFFGSGALFLTASLAVLWAGMHASPRSHVGGQGLMALGRLGMRNAARSPVRSLLTAGLLASAAFLLVAVESFRRSAAEDFLARDSGSGGFAWIAETDVPLFQSLESEKGHAEILETLERRLRSKEAVQKAEDLLLQVKSFGLRVRAGDDASCLNLYEPRKPRLFGVPQSLLARGGFHFADGLPMTEAEKTNPWLLLDRTFEDGAIPVIGEANTVKWILKRGLGEDISVTDERGRPARLRIVGLLSDSVFQTGLLLSETRFLSLYPSSEGAQFFLLETGPEGERTVRLLEAALGERGFEATASLRRLEAYLAVENTYLSTFQALGFLGLFLGTLGLAVLLMRTVWERRSELALLRSLGYRHRDVGWLLLAENGFLLLLGLGAGTLAATLSVSPHLIVGTGSIPWARLLGMLALVAVSGIVAGAAALLTTLRAPLVPALRRE